MKWSQHVTRIVVGPLQTNCYIVLPLVGSDALVVDPGGDSDRIGHELEKRGLTLERIILTHGHIDHVLDVERLLTGAMHPVPVHIHPDDRELLERIDLQAGFMGLNVPSFGAPTDPLTDGDRIRVAGRELEILHTPGHSPGSISLLLRDERILLSGDTIFCGGVGRTDLWGGSWKILRRSIETRLLTLDPETVVLPGHGETTTIGSASMWLRETALYFDLNEGFE